MKKLITIVTLLTSISSFASMADLAREVAKNIKLESSSNAEEVKISNAKVSAIKTDLYYACSESGIEVTSDYGITLDCEEVINDALEAGLTANQILEVING